ncbi:MAG: HD domain-containing protein [Candidatus Micrarchaeota archaeon]
MICASKIEKVRSIVEKEAGYQGDHGYSHIMRVYENAMEIAENEKCDKEIVALAALLHDIKEGKGHAYHHIASAKRAREILGDLNYSDDTVEAVCHAVEAHSFSKPPEPKTVEAKIIQDADRLDALGAIGIARCFSYGGRIKRKMYFEGDPFRRKTKPKYDSSQANIDHFYLKLLTLKGKMHTKTARKIAKGRTDYMLNYLKQFEKEIKGDA